MHWGMVLNVLVLSGGLQANQAPAHAGPSIGNLVRVQIAHQYDSEDVSVAEGRLSLPGALVRRDRETLTVSTGSHELRRFPAGGARLIGHVSGAHDRAIFLELEGGKGDVEIPREAIERLDVASGQTNQARTGALVGLVTVGVPLGASAVLLSYLVASETSAAHPARTAALGAAASLAFGACVGAIVGSALRAPKWEKLDLRGGVAPLPHGGIAAGLTVRF